MADDVKVAAKTDSKKVPFVSRTDGSTGWVDQALAKIEEQDIEKLRAHPHGGGQAASHVEEAMERRATGSRRLYPHELTSIRAAERVADARIAAEKK